MTWMAFGVFRVCSAQQSVETLTVQKEAAQNSVVGRVLIDSYHAHNFLHRGLRPKEYSYHCYSALRRAADLLKRRGCEVSELLVGPITEDHLENVDLYVLNLPSMDRPPLLVEEVIALENFVRAGGGIVFVTDHSNCYYHQYSLLPLWHALGLIPTFETVCVRSKVGRLSHTGNAWVVLRDFLEHPVTSGLRQVAFQTGGRVVGKGAVAFTEADAWADAGATPLYGEGNIGLYGDLQFSASEESGRQAMVLARSIGQGRVVVIADQNAVGDAAIAYADNWKLWLNACRWAGSLKYRSSAATDSQWQVICYEPLGVKKTAVEGPQRLYDWGAQDPDQYHYLWVWMNRRRWVACNDQVDVPPEYSADRTLAFIESRRLGDERARGLAAQVIASEGVLVVLGELKKLDVLFDGQPMRPSSVQRFEWPELLDVASYALSEKQASYPVLIHVQNPESLTNAAFPEPGTQPSTEQAQLQETLNRFMDSL
ncbi:MAG TPA: hypothetical protein DDW52_27410 [Planctomycetaceae bacterium]|nr:hypothetical protein [Planctomycetaceae bacterium]